MFPGSKDVFGSNHPNQLLIIETAVMIELERMDQIGPAPGKGKKQTSGLIPCQERDTHFEPKSPIYSWEKAWVLDSAACRNLTTASVRQLTCSFLYIRQMCV